MSQMLIRACPRDNIFLRDDATTALWQAGHEVLRCDMTDTVAAMKTGPR